MRSSRKSTVFSASSSSSSSPSSTTATRFTTTVTYTFHNDHTTTEAATDTKTPPVSLPPPPELLQSQAANKIQSHYRAHLVRTLYKKISNVSSEADALQRRIQRQETVDAIRSDEREKLRMNEALMALLLRLDSVPGVNPTVRDARRKVSRRIVELQEILDGICEAKVECDYYYYDDIGWAPYDFDKVVEKLEEDVCIERGGEEMERFCAHYLGFRCLQRFLRD